MKPKTHFCKLLVSLTVLAFFSSPAQAEDVEDEIQSMVTRGQLDLAKKKLEALGDAGHSKSTKANFLYAQCLLFSGKFDEAEPILKQCAKAEDTDYRRIPYHASNMLKSLPEMKVRFAELEKMKKLGYTGLVIKQGNIVELVVKGTSAESAGVKAGDKLTEIDGSPVPEDYNQTIELIRGPLGSSVALVFERDGKTLNCKLDRSSSLAEISKKTFQIEGRIESLKNKEEQKTFK